MVSKSTQMNCMFQPLIDRIGKNSFGFRPIETPVFTIFPDGYDDCHCGHDARIEEWDQNNPHEDGCAQVKIQNILKDVGFAAGGPQIVKIVHEADFHPDTPLHEVCTCGQQIVFHNYKNATYHHPQCHAVRANFTYFPTDFKIWWKKYPFKGIRTNFDMDNKAISGMIEHCMAFAPEVAPEQLIVQNMFTRIKTNDYAVCMIKDAHQLGLTRFRENVWNPIFEEGHIVTTSICITNKQYEEILMNWGLNHLNCQVEHSGLP